MRCTVMAKFVIECPNCGKYAEAKTGFFTRKRIDCACGYTINIKTDKLTSRKCSHCGNEVFLINQKAIKLFVLYVMNLSMRCQIKLRLKSFLASNAELGSWRQRAQKHILVPCVTLKMMFRKDL